MARSIGENINGQPVESMGMVGMSGGRSQRGTRIYAGHTADPRDEALAPFVDQFGREFAATCHVDTMLPIEELRCISHDPPWAPPMRFARFGRKGSSKFHWDLSEMAKELAAETDRWYGEARQLALREHLPVPDVGGPVDRMIRDVKGYPPLSPEVPLALEAGDPYMLGVRGTPRSERLEWLITRGQATNMGDTVALIRERLAKGNEPSHILEELPPEAFGAESPTDVVVAHIAAVVEQQVAARLADVREAMAREAQVRAAAQQAQAAKMRAAKRAKHAHAATATASAGGG